MADETHMQHTSRFSSSAFCNNSWPERDGVRNLLQALRTKAQILHWAVSSGRTRCRVFVCFFYSCKGTTWASVSHVHTPSTNSCCHPTPSIRRRFTSLTMLKKKRSNSFISDLIIWTI